MTRVLVRMTENVSEKARNTIANVPLVIQEQPVKLVRCHYSMLLLGTQVENKLFLSYTGSADKVPKLI